MNAEDDTFLLSVASQESSTLNNESPIEGEATIPKISPEIQEKVDIFQVDKRKAETSPELSKNQKKKNKKKQSVEKTTSL